MACSPDKPSDATRAEPWQFNLRTLFLLVFHAAIVFAPAAYWGLQGIGVGIFAMLGLLLFWSRWRRSPVEFVVLFVLLGMIVLLIESAPPLDSHTATLRGRCQNNLKRIALALHAYHEAHGSFPPAYIADKDGTPMHSWRVLILPYLEEQRLYRDYSFDEPWDGPNNRKLHDRMPRVFGCPFEDSAANGCTSYVAIVGYRTMWPGSKGRSLGAVADGIANTLLVAEVQSSGIHWMEPRDLDHFAMALTISQGPRGRNLSSGHGRGANVAMADGSVHFLPETTSVEQLDALLSAAGGEPVTASGRR